MPHSGETLGADLVKLYDAGTYKIPEIADQFRDASAALIDTYRMTGVFARHPDLGGTFGPAQEPWEALRDAIVDIVMKTAVNLEDTGAVLVMAADEYAKNDQAAARTFDELKEPLDRSHGVAP